METQLELSPRQRVAALRADEDVKRLVAALRGRGWTVKDTLKRELGWNERRIQDAKEHSGCAVISSSRRGYCLADEATHAEFADAINEQRNRFQTLERNYLAMLRRFHSLHQTEAA